MNAENIEVFIHHGSDKPKVAPANPSETLAQVLANAGVTLSPDSHIFVTTGEDENDDIIGDEDAIQPVSPATTMADAKLGHHGHIHCHACRRIEVTMNFQEKSKSRKFAPSARIARIRRWAIKAFELSGPAASDFVLQLCGSDQRPRPNQDLAELVKPGTCAICFDLVKEVTPQG